MPRERIYARIKRGLDVVVAALLLVLLSPVIGLVALAVRLQMGTPVVFRQKRPGLHGQPFELLKFRSMIDAFDAEGRLRSDAERLTPLGRWLRATSLDELPQLWNVLRGDMSLVGPRPLLMDYLPLYSESQARRHDVRPGVTGLAQVKGRNLIDWREKFELDIWYVDHLSFLLDLRILGLTVIKVLRRDGIDAGGGTTMPRFEGTSPVRKGEGR
ncbi:Sugar transferase involved in LPS biosynthesis (colanic, teichoic acid) [Devosia enhydra]|uniref:Sugar transferase involved in LPS biosynthesis (Colanic, teichoic acid) n=1 Tax=Devosia enhydra TaxID=665118 RepID=A0A1K2HW97_9HYPH|nr:sugar transferase [Devosia enhydra]SFZ82271.1 Sugar transferase involved in LPS biosynthesis (colanic, teichoic acid) [Devosia enhydra]